MRSASAMGMPSSQPWAESQPRAWSRSSWICSSTPSATARQTEGVGQVDHGGDDGLVLGVAAEAGHERRSILSTSTGNCRR